MKRVIIDYLDRRLGKHVTKRVCHVCRVLDGAWSVVCMVTVLGLCAVAGFMALQRPTIKAIDQSSGGSILFINSYSPQMYVTSPVKLSPDVHKAAYDTYIVDGLGHRVYTFPPIVTDKPAQNVKFKVPELSPGIYYIHTHITYALNPIKNSTLNVEVAKLVIQDDQ